MINVRRHFHVELVYVIVIKHHITIQERILVYVLDMPMIHVQLILNVYQQPIVRQQHVNVQLIIILIHQNINVFENNSLVKHVHKVINV